ncbi:PAS domain-containing methyl-accepting chemotaxis protein [uncultured Caulobacter sp.]|uniref:methyl-accepting chemotaxis protein n=1 Tax=uncultured Caulobacter sp. TaxID=158749 RepID=UPI00261FB50B|nr:PAS domain-containing methyl-accepting chemotaxis protein [uncultured Caulobacter sp.]
MLFSTRPKSKQAATTAELRELKAQVAAMELSQAVIEFKLDGTILRANANFLNALGYRSEEVIGRHHSIFVPPDEAASAEYRAFWEELNSGRFIARKFRRIGKSGAECWIQASYNPVLDENGKPYKVIKFATDVTAIEHERMRSEGERQRAAEEQEEVVSNLAESLKRLARGNLTARISAQFRGRYAQIKDDFNAAIDSLREAMNGIAATTSGLRAGADEISSASDDLSRRTEQQAASLEQTAAALDEITATVRRSAEGAKQASAAASGARTDAARSGEVMRDAVAAMGEIEQSSSQITNIIGVIDEIAFQTNLLALNAGVEAARAGEAGRGFAVVAQEVRALAQRSADAAKEIKTLIASSTAQVERGVKLVGDTGQALTGIVGKIAEIDILISEIATSSQEQATGLNEVNTAVNQMDQVTQQNAAMVEEATAAAANLKTEAGELERLVSRFQADAAVARLERPPTRGHAPAADPIARSRAKIAAFTRSSGVAQAAAQSWEEF